MHLKHETFDRQQHPKPGENMYAWTYKQRAMDKGFFKKNNTI